MIILQIQHTVHRNDSILNCIPGKSTLINGLIGVNLLESGVLPTTNKICIIRHESQQNVEGTAWKQADNMILGDVQEIKIDLPWLKNIAIVDTPGTNAIVSDHEHLTQQIIPRADLVLFVTSAERPMSDSGKKFTFLLCILRKAPVCICSILVVSFEKLNSSFLYMHIESAVLTKIKEWGRKVVMIVNKMDILLEPSDKDKVINFVTQHAAKILGDTVSLLPIYGVSGRLALNAKLLNSSKNRNSLGASNWEDSRFGSLEKYLMSVLGQEQLIKSKLKNPLGVADRIITDSITNLENRQHVLEGDFRVLEMIEENMVAYKNDMEREIKLFRINIKTLLQQVSDRCEKYLERKITVLNSSFLLDTKSFQEEFSREVLMDLNQPIDDILVDMCNLISKKSKVQARSVVDFVGNRPKKHRDSIVGSVNFVTPDDTQFDASKYDLIERIRRNIRLILTTHDQTKNVVKISSEVRTSLLITAAVQVGK